MSPRRITLFCFLASTLLSACNTPYVVQEVTVENGRVTGVEQESVDASGQVTGVSEEGYVPDDSYMNDRLKQQGDEALIPDNDVPLPTRPAQP